MKNLTKIHSSELYSMVVDRFFQIDYKKAVHLSYATLDPLGRVFRYEDKIYRGIYPDKVKYVKNIFDCGLYGELKRRDLIVETKISRKTCEQYPLILNHKILTTTIPTEWTATMLKDAALLILDVNKCCNKYGYELGDAHPYNVLFDGSKPVWVDFGSIVKKNKEWGALREFVNYTIVPLTYLTFGELYEGYSILQSIRTFKIASKDFRETFLYANFLILAREDNKSPIEGKIDKKWIKTICSIVVQDKMYWSDYQRDIGHIILDMRKHEKNKFNRFFKLVKLIKKYSYDARSVLDLAGNTGLLTFILRKSLKWIEKYINTDYDYYSIEKSYSLVKSMKLDRVETYLLNFMLPMHFNVYQNLKSDVVLAMAVTHHLLLTQGFKIDEIFEKIAAFSNKYVYIEFMPLGMWGGDKINKPDIPRWYTQEYFEEKFKSHFSLLKIEVLESCKIADKQENHRVLFIGKLKD